MLKLSSVLCILLLSIVASIYYGYSSNDTSSNSSVFGRTIYDTNSTVGSKPDPHYKMSFPDDHQAHPDFDIEWWYLTANLRDEDGDAYGLQWTLFRFTDPAVSNQSPSSWGDKQLFMAHASVHSSDNHWFSEKLARAGVGNALVSDNPFSLEIDDWRWRNAMSDNNLLPASLVFSAHNMSPTTPNSSDKIKVAIQLSATGPIVKQGINGYSTKTEQDTHSSHYYSVPFINVEGSLSTENDTISVTGQAWFDHEWTSGLLDKETQGWDWFSLHLDNGDKLMAFRMRMTNGNDYITANYIDATGTSNVMLQQDLTLLPIAMLPVTTYQGETLMPLEWRVSIPNKNLNIVVKTTKQQQWNPALVPYYEGQINITGTHTGTGFMELTGY